MRKLLAKIYWTIRMFVQPKYVISYSQCGEDIILRFVFTALKIAHPRYIDIGAHDPIVGSNTYLFYTAGSRGVCVEPNPTLYTKIARVRPRDICLKIGVGPTSAEAVEYFEMTSETLNTFSRAEAERYVSSGAYGGQEIKNVLQLPLIGIGDLMERYGTDYSDLISIDVEGLDFTLIQAFDFTRYRPKVFCIETARGVAHHKAEKNQLLIEYLEKQGYRLYADTFINSIFVDEAVWPF